MAWVPGFNPAKPTLALFFVAALVLQHFGYIIGRWYTYEGWMCADEFTVRDQANTGCAAQAFFGTFGTISACVHTPTHVAHA